jgi:hypothetical protein
MATSAGIRAPEGEEELKAVVRSIKSPAGVQLRNVWFDFDHSGDPAVYVSFAISQRLGFAPSRLRLLQQYKQRVLDSVYAAGTERLAYVRFEDAK